MKQKQFQVISFEIISVFCKNFLSIGSWIAAIILLIVGVACFWIGAGWVLSHFISDPFFVIISILGFLGTVISCIVAAFNTVEYIDRKKRAIR